jgi:hypothetical protein
MDADGSFFIERHGVSPFAASDPAFLASGAKFVSQAAKPDKPARPYREE